MGSVRISGYLLRGVGRVAEKIQEVAADKWKSFVRIADGEDGLRIEACNDDLAVRVMLPSQGSSIDHVVPKVDTARLNDKDDVSLDRIKRATHHVVDISSPFTLRLQPSSGGFDEMPESFPDLDDTAFLRLTQKPVPVLVTDVDTLRKACSVAADLGATCVEIIVPKEGGDKEPFFMRASLPGEDNAVLLSVRKTSIAKGEGATAVTEPAGETPLFDGEPNPPAKKRAKK
jgi:hypothetical protein